MISRFTKCIVIFSLMSILGCGGFSQKTKKFIKSPFGEKSNSEKVIQGAESEHSMRGKDLFRKGDMKGALKEFEAAVEISPSSPEIHYNLGLAYYELHRYSEAINEFTKTAQLKPDIADAYFNMGVAYYQTGQADKALNAYDKAVKYGLNDAPLHFNMGLSYLKLSKFEEAKRENLKAIEIEPDLAEAYCNLGYIAEARGEIDNAINMYNKAVNIRPDYLVAKENLECLTKGISRPEKTVKVERGPLMRRFNVELEGKWGVEKDIDLDGTRGKVTVCSAEKRGIFKLGYDVTKWLDFSLNLGVTDMEFKDPEKFDSVMNIHQTFTQYSKYEGFKDVLGLAGGIGINADVFTLRRLNLGFDTGFEFLMGSNKDELKGTPKITATADWKEYMLSLRMRYLKFRNIVPYGGVTFSKLDGNFELKNSNGNCTKVDYNESDPVGILLGGSYYMGEHLRFQTEARFLDEISLAIKAKYRF